MGLHPSPAVKNLKCKLDVFLQSATNVAEKMLQRDTYPMPKIFRFLLNRLASTGHVEMMNTIGHYFTTAVKKEVSYDNRCVVSVLQMIL